MSVFIELTTDAFSDRFNQVTNAAKTARKGAGSDNVRRPLRGLEIKDDTYGIIKVITSDGNEIKLIDSSSADGTSTANSNFIIQSIQEARMEKHQIVETFGDAYIYFFGEAPRFLDVQAVLVDSLDFNWYAEFMANYDQYFRGTKLVEMGARAYLFYEDNIVQGYMLNTTVQKTSQAPLMVQMNFRLYLTDYSNISLIGDPNFPVRGDFLLPPNSDTPSLSPTDQNDLLASQGTQAQQSGFGGGDQLQTALAQQAGQGSVPPELFGPFFNASQALDGGGSDPSKYQRTLPLRSKIADNNDEFTSGKPSPAVDRSQAKLLPDDEVDDLTTQSMDMLTALGAQPSDTDDVGAFPGTGVGAGLFAGAGAGTGLGPDAMNQLGLGPQFNNSGFPLGIGAGPRQPGFGAVSGISASFGVRIGTGISGGIGAGSADRLGGGVGGGLGFSGRASSGYGLDGGFSAPYTQSLAQANAQYGYTKRSTALAQLNQAGFTNQVDFNYFNSFKNSASYTNGVRTNGGLTLGVGIAGGIGKPFAPVGGVPYSVNQPPPSGYGYNPFGSPYSPNYGPGPASFGYPGAPPNASFGGPGNGGANVFVGGAPSAFSMIAVGGTLTPDGLSTFSFSSSSDEFD